MSSPVHVPQLGKQFAIFNGPLFIGTMFNWALFGIVTLQVYIYYTSKFKDSFQIRGLVGAVYILDIIQTIFATHVVWEIVILGWGDPTTFEHAGRPWTSVTLPIMSGIISGLVQTFFAWRIWALRGTWWATCTAILIVLIALMQCISGIVFSIRSHFINILDINKLRSGIVVWLVGAFSCDFIIMVTMIIVLRSTPTPIFKRTRSVIDKLTIQTIHTGAITAIVASAELALFYLAPDNFMHYCPALFLSKTYSNVLMANLNGRRRSDISYVTTCRSNLIFGGNGPNECETSATAVFSCDATLKNSKEITTITEALDDTISISHV